MSKDLILKTINGKIFCKNIRKMGQEQKTLISAWRKF